MNESRADKRHLLQDANGYLAIEKLSNHGATVGLAGPFGTKWEGEARSELFRLFQTAVNKKREALERKGVLTICRNFILLFYDAYGFCDMEDAIEAFNRCGDLIGSIQYIGPHPLQTDRTSYSPEHQGEGGAFFTARRQNGNPNPLVHRTLLTSRRLTLRYANKRIRN